MNVVRADAARQSLEEQIEYIGIEVNSLLKLD